MNWAGGYCDSLYGRIESAWHVEDGTLTHRATVPANTTATLYLPASSAAEVMEGGNAVSGVEDVRFIREEDDSAVYELTSGSYEVHGSLEQPVA